MFVLVYDMEINEQSQIMQCKDTSVYSGLAHGSMSTL